MKHNTREASSNLSFMNTVEDDDEDDKIFESFHRFHSRPWNLDGPDLNFSISKAAGMGVIKYCNFKFALYSLLCIASTQLGI